MAIGAAVAVGLVGAAIVPVPLVGVFVGALALLALIAPENHIFLSAGAVLSAALGGAYVLVSQVTEHFGSLGWPGHFELAGDLIWAAVALLAAHVVVDVVLDAGGTGDAVNDAVDDAARPRPPERRGRRRPSPPR